MGRARSAGHQGLGRPGSDRVDLLDRREAVRHPAKHSTVTELEPGRVFGWDSKGALGTVHHRFTVAAADSGTTLTKSAEFLDRSFLAKMTSWKISRGLPAGLQADVEKIKGRLESRSG